MLSLRTIAYSHDSCHSLGGSIGSDLRHWFTNTRLQCCCLVQCNIDAREYNNSITRDLKMAGILVMFEMLEYKEQCH